ncbi:MULTISPECIES: cytochrome b/b6 domain-containing protein [Methylobacter]|uniref:cytochrome b/b6 domain-containing protein n=1 Tax=Methylobacter TaxID=429 RepID=UPI001FADE91C|nr:MULTISPECIES: cytochrome b/b6 domain-containing protein [Methylobacter]UOA10110.1 cytochrome b/b6 domain-containing protein [Methylobacter sp. S3L5C]
MKVTIHIWDLPHRLFHWLLAVSVAASYITAKIGGSLIDWHGRLGIFILGLLIFRIIWGFIGSTHSRFSTFFPTFSRLAAYLKGRWQGIGHNPLGALSVIALLTTVAVQVGTGLFANDDIAFEGPLFDFVDKSFSNKLTGLHSTTFYVLLGFVVLHIVAIIFYRWVKKTNLVTPMLTGKKEIPVALAEAMAITPDKSFGPMRFILSMIISGTVVWGVSGGITQLYPVQSQQQTAQAPSSF